MNRLVSISLGLFLFFSQGVSLHSQAHFSLDFIKEGIAQIRTVSLKFNWREPYKQPDQELWMGSGFFVKNDVVNGEGYLLTNYHVVSGGYSIQALFPSTGMEWFDLEVVGVYPSLDCALIRLKKDALVKAKKLLGNNKISYLPLGDSDKIMRLDPTYAVGYPLGQSHWKVTEGITCGLERPDAHGKLLVQTDAPINPGNSGGAVLNSDQQVVGMASSGVLFMQNIGFFIPINDIKFCLPDLVKGSPKQVRVLQDIYAGVEVGPSSAAMDESLGNPTDGGCVVLRVHEGSFAKKHGVQPEDKIYALKAGNNIYSIDRFGEVVVPWCADRISLGDLIERLARVYKELTLVTYRRGEKRELRFNFNEKIALPIRHVCPEYEPERTDYEALFGMVVMELALNHLEVFQEAHTLDRYHYFKNCSKERLIVTHIVGGSQADKALQLAAGVIIRKVNDIPVFNLSGFRAAALKSKESGFLKIETEDDRRVVIKVSEALADEHETAMCAGYPLSGLIKQLR